MRCNKLTEEDKDNNQLRKGYFDKSRNVFRQQGDNIRVSVPSGDFPITLFDEWESDCRERYGGSRWMKMWNDHLASKSMEMYIDLAEQLSEMKSRVSILEEKPEQEEKVVETVKTFSSGNEKGDK